jgi:L,D-transpeptidase ErfK/SrfK
LALVLLGGCASIESLFDSIRREPEAPPVPLEERPPAEPIHPNEFVLESAEQSVIGVPQVVFASPDDTLSDLARAYGLGYDEIIAANPGVNPWLPGENTPILLPTQYILPDVPKEGIVLNMASKRLFYFPAVAEGEKQLVRTYPIGIGRVGWETPLGATTVVSKAKDPHWFVPASVRREHRELGNPLPAVVPPGPDNPLGHRVLKLEMPGYLIHGTNQPFGVGMRVSHGCIRLYPENIELLYELVAIGETVQIINEPFLFGRLNGELYFEGHAPLEDDTIDAVDRLDVLLAGQTDEYGAPLYPEDVERVRALAAAENGVPGRVTRRDEHELLARIRVVHNTVEVDPDAPTLIEVREMIEEAVREGREADEAALDL